MHQPSPRNHRAHPGTRHRACRVLAAMLVSLFPASIAAPPPTLFVKACAPCHGKDGKASTPAARKLGVKDLSLSQLSDAEIQRQMIDGRKGPDGSIKMPSFQHTLKPSEIELLARYVKSLQRPGAAPSKPAK